MKVSVIYGSVRNARKGINGAKFLCKKLEERDVQVKLIDPLEADLPMLDKMYKEYEEDQAPEKMTEISNILNESDAFIVVSGEYNHSVPPALKNLLDHFQKEYYFKACGIASYSGGSFGGSRVGVHLRAILGELGMATNSIMFAMSKVASSFDEEGNAIDESYDRRVKRFLDEFLWLAEALNEQRKKYTPY